MRMSTIRTDGESVGFLAFMYTVSVFVIGYYFGKSVSFVEWDRDSENAHSFSHDHISDLYGDRTYRKRKYRRDISSTTTCVIM